jgi:Tol biopolymer transport system component
VAIFASCGRGLKNAAGTALALTGLVAVLAVPVGATPTRQQPSPGRNGRLLLFAQEESRVLHTLDLAGGKRKVRNLRVRAEGAAWSPDGQRLAVGSSRLGIRVGRSDGTRLRRVARGIHPAWSPDGSRIVYEKAKAGLFVARADGSRPSRLTMSGSTPDWSPDGSRILYEDGGDVAVVSLDNGRIAKLADSAPPNCGEYVTPRWSPTGERIAWEFVGCSQDTATTSSTLGVMDADGSNHQALICCDYWAPVWSPDGRLLAFHSHDAPSRAIASIEVATERFRVLHKGVLAEPLDWRPRCTLTGNRRADRLNGTAGPDLVCGLGGADTITGGSGQDQLFGQDGNDRFLARDGEFDVIGCGLGRDRVDADLGDIVGVDCERAERA